VEESIGSLVGGRHPGLVIKPPVLAGDLGDLPPLSSRLDSPFLVAVMGAVHHERDLIQLVDALAFARNSGLDIRVEFIGGPVPTGEGLEAWDWLLGRINNLKLTNWFTFTGTAVPSRIRDLLSRANLLVETAQPGMSVPNLSYIGAALKAGVPVLVPNFGILANSGLPSGVITRYDPHKTDTLGSELINLVGRFRSGMIPSQEEMVESLNVLCPSNHFDDWARRLNNF